MEAIFVIVWFVSAIVIAGCVLHPYIVRHLCVREFWKTQKRYPRRRLESCKANAELLIRYPRDFVRHWRWKIVGWVWWWVEPLTSDGRTSIVTHWRSITHPREVCSGDDWSAGTKVFLDGRDITHEFVITADVCRGVVLSMERAHERNIFGMPKINVRRGNVEVVGWRKKDR